MAPFLSSCGHQYLHFKESDKTLFKQKFYHDLPCEIISVKVCNFSDLCKEVLKSYYLFLVCSGTIPSTAPGANSGFFQRRGATPNPSPWIRPCRTPSLLPHTPTPQSPVSTGLKKIPVHGVGGHQFANVSVKREKGRKSILMQYFIKFLCALFKRIFLSALC